MKIPTHKATSLFAALLFSAVLLFYPGQNKIQTISIHPKTSNVLGAKVDYFQKNDLPKIISGISQPNISARSAIVLDVGSAVVLYEKNPDASLPPASTTKIMTALVALDEYDLKDVITIENENFSIGNKSHIVQGERLSVESLLYALLVSSGNDAALALAQHHPRGYVGFIDQMNKKAKDLSLSSTNYSNVSGVEQPTHLSSARDLGVLAREAMMIETFANIVSETDYVITSEDGSISHSLTNTNQLLGSVDGVLGVKTGWTYLAGECLVTFVSREGRQIITVVLGSDDRFLESEKLIDWSYENHVWESFPEI